MMRYRLILLAAALGLLLAACTPAAPATPVAAAPSRTAPPSATAGAPGQSPGEPAAGGDLTRTDEQGAVVFAVTPLNLDAGDPTLDFTVALNTHSVELNFDLAAVATLSTDSGREVAALSWDGGGGGHHLSGMLSFPARTEDGAALLEGARQLTLTITGVDAAARVFVWDLGD